MQVSQVLVLQTDVLERVPLYQRRAYLQEQVFPTNGPRDQRLQDHGQMVQLRPQRPLILRQIPITNLLQHVHLAD